MEGKGQAENNVLMSTDEKTEKETRYAKISWQSNILLQLLSPNRNVVWLLERHSSTLQISSEVAAARSVKIEVTLAHTVKSLF